ncbi:MAG: DUF1015 domain-containing protein [Promethearchaeota archaeon]
MVKIAPIKPYLPVSPEKFCTNPYDVINSDEEAKLKQNPNSLIHLILPDGEGEEVYQNARKAFDGFQTSKTIIKADKPAIYVYRQESPEFSQQGFIMGVALQDYEEGNIVRHEHTREKPLKDRTKHIATIKAATGLVWNVFKANIEINAIMEQIKEQKPLFDFTNYGYRQIVWQETDPTVIAKLAELFKKNKIYIADGHHRCASANEYRKMKLAEGASPSGEEPWQYLMTYVASDDQIWILPYNRIVRKLPMSEEKFLEDLESVYNIELVDHAFNPNKKHEVAICLKGKWYKLTVKATEFPSIRDALDVAILQDQILDPILGIKDPRKDKNIFFEGNVKYYKDPSLMEKEFIREQGNDLFINLYSVDMHDIEKIGEAGGVMPPKSTWFEPKLLSGITILGLEN